MRRRIELNQTMFDLLNADTITEMYLATLCTLLLNTKAIKGRSVLNECTYAKKAFGDRFKRYKGALVNIENRGWTCRGCG